MATRMFQSQGGNKISVDMPTERYLSDRSTLVSPLDNTHLLEGCEEAGDKLNRAKRSPTSFS